MPMKYSMTETSNGLSVNATVGKEQQAQLLSEFGKCAAGTCTCPSTQYDKLEAINVQQTDEGVKVDLTAKAGEKIDLSDISRCLDHTAQLLAKA